MSFSIRLAQPITLSSRQYSLRQGPCNCQTLLADQCIFLKVYFSLRSEPLEYDRFDSRLFKADVEFAVARPHILLSIAFTVVGYSSTVSARTLISICGWYLIRNWNSWLAEALIDGHLPSCHLGLIIETHTQLYVLVAHVHL